MAHPLVEWRTRHGLSRRAAALAAKAPYSTWANTELGIPSSVPVAVLALVEAVDGLDAADRLAGDYLRWRREAGERLLAGMGA